MNTGWIKQYLIIICLLAGSIYTGAVYAGWSYDPYQSSYNRRYGDFPPMDIDRQLQEDMTESETLETDASQKTDNAQSNNVGTANDKKPVVQSTQSITSPATTAPTTVPATTTPATTAPAYGVPTYGYPAYSYPGYGYPGYGMPPYGTPGYGAPVYNTPGYAAPGAIAPATDVAEKKESDDAAINEADGGEKKKKKRKKRKKRKSTFPTPWGGGSGFDMPWGDDSDFFPWDKGGFNPWGGKKHRH